MPTCPKCNGRLDSPDKVIPVIVESAEGEHGVTQSEVGIFRCKRCDTMFPHVLSSKRYVFLPQTELTRMGQEIAHLQSEKTDLQKSLNDHLVKEGALLEAKEKAQLEGLESKAQQLESYVDYLRAEKKELEKETSH